MAYVNFLEVVYPVGSCYFSVQSTSPAAIVGGTWTQLTGGVLGLAGSTGVADAGKEGGSRKISVEQMPSHNHSTPCWVVYDNGGWYQPTDGRAHPDNGSGGQTPFQNDYFDVTYTGGGAGLCSCSLLCLLLGAHLLASLAVM